MTVDLTKYIEEHYFQFDNVFDSDISNQDIYTTCVLPLVCETFKGAKNSQSKLMLTIKNVQSNKLKLLKNYRENYK